MARHLQTRTAIHDLSVRGDRRSARPASRTVRRRVEEARLSVVFTA